MMQQILFIFSFSRSIMKEGLQMDKIHKLKIICSCFVTISLLVVSLRYLTDLMELKDSDSNYLPFFDQSEDFDVLFMGSSHVMLGIYPMELWNDYGIVSYNMGGPASAIPTTYWVMENALEKTTPKLVVIDCFLLGTETKTGDNFSYVHYLFDVFPLNATKVSAIRDLLDDPVWDSMQQAGVTSEIRKRTEMELWWNYTSYHTRWNELSAGDFNVSCTKRKGAGYRIAIATPNAFAKIPTGRKLEGETTGIKYLRKMIEDCQNRGIEVMLIYIPFPAGEDVQLEANRVYDIAAEYGVNYINFLDMDLVNYKTDCFDAYSHLNPSGGYKVTEYIGQYITEHYNIPDQRLNPAYDSWYADYKEWTEEKVGILKETEYLDIYLMLLADQHFEAEIEINNLAIWEDEYYVRLLNNIGIYEENYETVAETGHNSGEEDSPDVHLTIKNKATGDIIDQADFSL